MPLPQHLYEYTHPTPHGVPHDSNTNDGLGWEGGQMQCSTCAYHAVYVWPADADPGTLTCPNCGTRSTEPPPERETSVTTIPAQPQA